MNRYLTILISLVALLLAVGTVYHVSDKLVYASHVSDKIPYPLKGLGGCSSYAECRKYCHDPLHYPECRDFAKQNNIKSKDIPEEDKKIVFNNAKKLLGCDGQETCQTHCAKRDNFDKCSSFAKFVGMTGGYMINPTNEALRKRADEFLGCELDKDCKNFCDVAENKEKCTSFAQEEGLGGGIRELGPGGCTTQETCQVFCKDSQNSDKCAGFIVTSSDAKKSSSTTFTTQNSGPGGCTSDSECNSFCSDPKNKDACNKYQQESGYQWSGPGGCTSAASCAAYCSKNYTDPECGGGQDAQQYEQQKQQYEQQYQQKQQEFQQMQQSQPQAPSTGVQGVSTTRGLLQLILDTLFRR